MASFDTSRTPRSTVRIFLLTAAAALGSSLARPALEAVPDDREQQLVDAVQAVQSEAGVQSEGLIDPLTALGLYYAERGDDASAVAAFERARQIVHVNYGLRSLEEAPLLQLLIRSHDALGDAQASWNLERELLRLARRHRNDMRTVPIFRSIAERRMGILDAYRNGGYPQEIVLGCYYGKRGTGCSSGSRGAAERAIRNDALRNYLAAITVLLRNERYSSDELRQLELQVIPASYQNDRYGLGRQSLRRLVSYDVANAEPLPTRVEGFVRIADWDLLFSRNGFALEEYEQAYAALREGGVAQSSIDAIFAPAIPVVLPTPLPNPLVSKRAPESDGYIDVSFEITKYGRSRQVEILETTTHASDEAANRLVDLIKGSRFRPRTTDGSFARADRVTLRYFVNE